eukprot:1544551-Rhodomonas_salina.1
MSGGKGEEECEAGRQGGRAEERKGQGNWTKLEVCKERQRQREGQRKCERGSTVDPKRPLNWTTPLLRRCLHSCSITCGSPAEGGREERDERSGGEEGVTSADCKDSVVRGRGMAADRGR